jgi:hypothetical protein
MRLANIQAAKIGILPYFQLANFQVSPVLICVIIFNILDSLLKLNKKNTIARN